MEQRLRDLIDDLIAGPDTRSQMIDTLRSILEDLEEDQRIALEDALEDAAFKWSYRGCVVR